MRNGKNCNSDATEYGGNREHELTTNETNELTN